MQVLGTEKWEGLVLGLRLCWLAGLSLTLVDGVSLATRKKVKSGSEVIAWRAYGGKMVAQSDLFWGLQHPDSATKTP